MRLACIDIGTNTTRLLVAEPADGRLREVLAQRAFTGLGHVRRRGGIGAAAIARVAATVADQARTARELGADPLRVVATAGVREAADGQALLDAVASVAAVAPTLLTGDEEARLAFLGATGMLAAAPQGSVGVIDVGGGSTELVVGMVGHGPDWWVSLPLGSAVVADECLRSDPPTPAELERARELVDRRWPDRRAPECSTAYAVGGSATSLARVTGDRLDDAALLGALESVTARPSAELAASLGLDQRRVRLLPAGILLLERAARALDQAPRVGAGGLREGVLLEEAGRAASGA